MYAYCTSVLHLSEAEAFLRIAVARAARHHPQLLTMLGDGRLHLSGIVKLAPLLTRENRDGLLKRATHLSKRQILELVAELSPRPDVPSVMRKLPRPRHLKAPRATLGTPAARGGLELGPDGVESPPRPTATQGRARPDAVAFELGPDGVGIGPTGVQASPTPTLASGSGQTSRPHVEHPS